MQTAWQVAGSGDGSPSAAATAASAHPSAGPGRGARRGTVVTGGRRSAIAQFVAIDLVAAAVGACAALTARFGAVNAPSTLPVDLLAAVSMPAAWVGAAALNRAYDLRRAGVGTAEFGALFRSFLHLSVACTFVSYAGDFDIARGFLLLALPLTLALSWAGRYVARVRLLRLRRAGLAMNRVLAVGSAGSITYLAESMLRDHSAGLHVVAACLPEDELADPAVVRGLARLGISALGGHDTVRAAVDAAQARSVAVVAGDVGAEPLRRMSWELEGSGADLIVSSGLSGTAHQRVHVQSVAGLPLLRVDEPQFAGFHRRMKGVFDRSVAAVSLVVLAPVLLALALLVRLTSTGPAFYRQTRIGLNGAPFRIVKFRSMRVGAESELVMLASCNDAAGGLLFKMREDPRVTRVGRVLRRFSLDELPQLLNVLTGSMSLVGPRPPLPSEVAQYRDGVSRRLLVKPGLTGVWQISGRSDLSWEESVRLDLHYIENWSFSLDLVVLLKTARAVVKAGGAY